MSEQPNSAPQATVATNDDLSRRRRVTGKAAVVAAPFGGATAEALAQGAPGGAPGSLRFLKASAGPVSANPGFNHAVEATGPGRIVYIAGQQGRDIDNKIVGAPWRFPGAVKAEQAFLNIKGALGAARRRLRARRQTLPLFRRPAGSSFPHDARYPAQIFRSSAHAGLDHDPGRRADRREGALRGRCGGRAAAGVSAMFLDAGRSDAVFSLCESLLVSACGASAAQNGEFVNS